MKLCEMVFAFHHSPSAMSGTDGTSTSSAPCSSASPTSRASHGECRRMPVRARALIVKASVGAATACRASMLASVFMASPETVDNLFARQFGRLLHSGLFALELAELVDRRVVAYIHFVHAPAFRVHIRILDLRVGFPQRDRVG